MRSTNVKAAPGANGAREATVADGAVERLTARGMQLREQGLHLEAARILAEVAGLLPTEWLAQYNAGAISLEAGEIDEAIGFFERTLALYPSAGAYAICAHALALRGDMTASRDMYERAAVLEPHDFAAHWGLFEVNQLLGDNDAALQHQALALAERSIVSIEARQAPARLTIVELCIAGTFQANIPLDFILDADHTTVHKVYVGEHPIPPLPAYDIVFNTIGDAPNADKALRAAETFIAGQNHPVLNAPRFVHLTSRDAVAAQFANSAIVAVAQTVRANRMTIHAVRPPYPFLIRPLDSHAGNDLERIDDGDALHAYLEAVRYEDFYLSAFVDYRNADGYYRKYRIVFVDGVAYPVHLAISPRWMIHYYNAPMAENAWMRDEEHAFMRDLSSVFSGVLADGLSEIAHAIPLDYFGIDCSIAPDGRVLLFEASSAMIVHMRDPVDLYPYKAKYVPRVIAALERLFAQRLQREAQP
jgi:tetratricopeptide (TPR) repeat protein